MERNERKGRERAGEKKGQRQGQKEGMRANGEVAGMETRQGRGVESAGEGGWEVREKAKRAKRAKSEDGHGCWPSPCARVSRLGSREAQGPVATMGSSTPLGSRAAGESHPLGSL